MSRYIAAYDIASNRRRRRVARALLGWGERLQRSVFEIEIDPGKTLIIKLISIGEADDEGRRALFFELNGMPRESVVLDKSLQSVSKASRAKGDPADPLQACAPMPGMVTEVAVSVGQEVKAGDKLVVLEAMKMLTVVSAGSDGTVKQVLVQKGEPVTSDDLLVVLTE